jgi:hypothetical protein
MHHPKEIKHGFHKNYTRKQATLKSLVAVNIPIQSKHLFMYR